LLNGEAPPFTAILSCELSPGGSVGPHVQQEFSEVVVGVEGRGEATVDGHAHALFAGDVVHLPLGSVLAIQNFADDAPLRYLIIKAQA
jgi:quercetin dioxygenase-like cupin family protein